jgi:hypothetical protein
MTILAFDHVRSLHSDRHAPAPGNDQDREELYRFPRRSGPDRDCGVHTEVHTGVRCLRFCDSASLMMAPAAFRFSGLFSVNCRISALESQNRRPGTEYSSRVRADFFRRIGESQIARPVPTGKLPRSAYYGVTDNYRGVARFYREVTRLMYKLNSFYSREDRC